MSRLSALVTSAVAAIAFVAAAHPAASSIAIATLDGRVLRGDPVCLAWSADGSSLYLEAAAHDHYGQLKSATHFIISLADRSVNAVDGEPPWAAAYWQWKSSRRSPASTTELIDVDTTQRAFHSTTVPTGGDLGRGGYDGGQTAQDAWSAAYQTQTGSVAVLKWKGATIGEWMNEAVVPGLTYGWAPAPRVSLAYAPRDGSEIVVIDADGRTMKLPGSRSALLPAWSNDGTKIAWVERKDRKHIVVVEADAPAAPS